MTFEESWEKMPHRESDYIKELCRGFYNEAIDEAVKIVLAGNSYTAVPTANEIKELKR